MFSTAPLELKVKRKDRDWNWEGIEKSCAKAWLNGSYDVMRKMIPFLAPFSNVFGMVIDRLVKLGKISLAKGLCQATGRSEKVGREWDNAVVDVSGGKMLLDSLPLDIRLAVAP
jgi:hypothetical protein